MEYAHWWSAHEQWFWIVPLVFMVLMGAFFAYRLRRAGGCAWESGHRAPWTPFGCCGTRRVSRTRFGDETPREILDRRYARGEITKEQYESIKREIESSAFENEPSDRS